MTMQQPKEAGLLNIAAGTEESKRDDRYNSICKDTEDEEGAKARGDNELGTTASYNAQEVEDVVFECINCSG